MKTAQELQKLLHQIDHKGYKAYKELKGTYQLKDYILCIDSVQGDPFATPSRVRLIVKNKGNFDTALFDQKHRKIATEDEILRNIHRFVMEEQKILPLIMEEAVPVPEKAVRFLPVVSDRKSWNECVF